MINNFNFPVGVEWSLNYTSGPDFFSDDFKFSTAEKLFYYYSGSVVKYLDISNATSARNMFYNCINLISIPQLDTSNVNDMYNMFYGCRNLLSIPQLDTSKVRDMTYMFYGCTKLTTIPQLDTSNVTNISGIFNDCTDLTTIPQLDTSNVTNISYIFQGCQYLRSIPLLDCSKVTSAYDILNPSYYGDQVHLTYMGGFKNIKVNFDIRKAPNLTVQSLMNVINNLYDFRANGESTTRTLQLGTTNLNKLTEEQKAVATNKGWSLT